MSLCQPNNNFSCGACCGLLNFELSSSELKKLLQERTIKFQSQVNLSIRWTVVEYRQTREKEESKIPKRDPTTYACPFLGYLEETQKKIGCMIHPSITGDPLSQNFSFYGASICQGYDCKNKQSANSKYWIQFLSKLKLNSIDYSKIAGDVLFWKYLNYFLEERGWSFFEFYQKQEKLLLELVNHKLQFGNPFPTSFEMDYQPTDKSNLEKLAKILQIDKNTRLYKKLERIKPRIRET